jgi:hypothetical protein
VFQDPDPPGVDQNGHVHPARVMTTLIQGRTIILKINYRKTRQILKPSLKDEARRIAELLSAAHEEGHAWNDMAILCRRHAVMDECATALQRRRLPHQVRKATGSFVPGAGSIALSGTGAYMDRFPA